MFSGRPRRSPARVAGERNTIRLFSAVRSEADVYIFGHMKVSGQRRVVKRKAQHDQPQESGQSDDLQEIADKLDQILRRSADTEERLEKLERLRAIEGQRQ
jgi:Mg2+ and Co2+ transporter CorA